MSKTASDYARCKNQLRQQNAVSEFSGNYGGRLKRYIGPDDAPVNRVFCIPDEEIHGEQYLTHAVEGVYIGVADCLDRERKLSLKFHGGGSVIFLSEDQDDLEDSLRERKLRVIRRIREKAVDQDSAWFEKYAGTSASDILAFCKQKDIVVALKSATSLAEKCFQPSTVNLEEDIDPETDDKHIRIVLSICGKSRQDVLAAYREFRQQLVAMVPSSKNMFIRLSYDIS